LSQARQARINLYEAWNKSEEAAKYRRQKEKDERDNR
jgi:hypothetical protein